MTSAPTVRSSCSGPLRRPSSCTSAAASGSGPTASSISRWATTATAAERPGPQQSAREDPADQQGRLDPAGQPVRRSARQAGGDLGVRIPQPLAVPVRQRHRSALRRRRGRLHLGGGQPHRQGRQLRLAASRKACARRAAPATSTRSTPIRTTARARRSPGARCTGPGCSRPSTRATCSSATTPRGSSRTRTSTSNGDITAVHDFDDAGRQRGRPEGRSGRLAVLPHLLARARCTASPTTPPPTCRWPAPPPTSPRASSRSRCTSPARAATIPDGDPLSYHWDLRRRDDQHRGEPDQDLHREGRVHRAPDRVRGRRPAIRRSRS